MFRGEGQCTCVQAPVETTSQPRVLFFRPRLPYSLKNYSVCEHYGMCVDARKQLIGVGACLPPCGLLGTKLVHRVKQEVPLPAEASPWFPPCFFEAGSLTGP